MRRIIFLTACLAGLCGCSSLSKTPNELLLADVNAAVDAAKQSNLDYDAELVLSPDGEVSFGPALAVQNRSVARLRFHGQFHATSQPAGTP